MSDEQVQGLDTAALMARCSLLLLTNPCLILYDTVLCAISPSGTIAGGDVKNLLGRLMGRSFEDLKAIAAAWQIPLPQLNHNDAAITLYREMAD
jgi:hypothetical protein